MRPPPKKEAPTATGAVGDGIATTGGICANPPISSIRLACAALGQDGFVEWHSGLFPEPVTTGFEDSLALWREYVARETWR